MVTQNESEPRGLFDLECLYANFWKNRVQPANSLQAKYFVSRAMMGELVAVPIFRSRPTFTTGCQDWPAERGIIRLSTWTVPGGQIDLLPVGITTRDALLPEPCPR